MARAPRLALALLCAAAAAAPLLACELRVLAFGDSLTEGLYASPDGYSRFHSYVLRLRQLLRGALPPRCHVVVHERGRSGEIVLRTMKERLSRALLEAEANDEPYAWVLILGGTNDIGTGADAADVLAALGEMHAAAAAHGARVLAMTLPPFNTRLGPERRAAYDRLNAGLRRRFGAAGAPAPAAAAAAGGAPAAPAPAPAASAGAAAGGAGGGGAPAPRALLLDLEPLFPVEGVDPVVKAATWSDNLHLTPGGYDRMAEAVFNAMRGPGPHGHRSKRRADCDEAAGAGCGGGAEGAAAAAAAPGGAGGGGSPQLTSAKKAPAG